MSRRIFPQLALVLFVFITAQVARAQESLPDLVRRVKPSVVSVLTYDAKDQPLISGSGFFVRPGEVVTNLHVINGARREGTGVLLVSDDDEELAACDRVLVVFRGALVKEFGVLPLHRQVRRVGI